MGAQKSLNASEISSLIKENIEKFEVETLERTEGQIVSSSDGIVSIHVEGALCSSSQDERRRVDLQWSAITPDCSDEHVINESIECMARSHRALLRTSDGHPIASPYRGRGNQARATTRTCDRWQIAC